MLNPLSLSIATLNTWTCDGGYRDRLRAMTAEARRLSPDVLLLQEAFAATARGDARDADTAAHLALALDVGFAAAPARSKDRPFEGETVRSVSGLATIARGEIMSSETVPLPVPPGDDERISQIVQLSIDSVRVLAVNTHLTHLDEEDDIRRDEIATTLDALPPLDRFDLAVLAGDFNCPPDSPPIRWLLEDANVGAVDLCAGMDMITRDTSTRYSPRQIDFIFLLEAGGGTSVAVEKVRRVFDTPDPSTGVLPSDHYGLMAEIVVG